MKKIKRQKSLLVVLAFVLFIGSIKVPNIFAGETKESSVIEEELLEKEEIDRETESFKPSDSEENELDADDKEVDEILENEDELNHLDDLEKDEKNELDTELDTEKEDAKEDTLEIEGLEIPTFTNFDLSTLNIKSQNMDGFTNKTNYALISSSRNPDNWVEGKASGVIETREAFIRYGEWFMTQDYISFAVNGPTGVFYTKEVPADILIDYAEKGQLMSLKYLSGSFLTYRYSVGWPTKEQAETLYGGKRYFYPLTEKHMEDYKGTGVDIKYYDGEYFGRFDYDKNFYMLYVPTEVEYNVYHVEVDENDEILRVFDKEEGLTTFNTFVAGANANEYEGYKLAKGQEDYVKRPVFSDRDFERNYLKGFNDHEGNEIVDNNIYIRYIEDDRVEEPIPYKVEYMYEEENNLVPILVEEEALIKELEDKVDTLISKEYLIEKELLLDLSHKGYTFKYINPADGILLSKENTEENIIQVVYKNNNMVKEETTYLLKYGYLDTNNSFIQLKDENDNLYEKEYKDVAIDDEITKVEFIDIPGYKATDKTDPSLPYSLKADNNIIKVIYEKEGSTGPTTPPTNPETPDEPDRPTRPVTPDEPEPNKPKPEIPKIPEIPEELPIIDITPDEIPEGHKIIETEEDGHILIDEDDIPYGTINIESHKEIENVEKINPQTSDAYERVWTYLLIALMGIALLNIIPRIKKEDRR